MIVKVKELIAPEYPRMREGQLLFTYLHLAPDVELTKQLLERKVTGIAYETITDRKGALPLLTPMSEVAGRMAPLVGAYYLQRPLGGRGTLLCGVPGVPPGDVVIIGGGIVGLNSAKVALGMGARVTILETNGDRMRFLDDVFHGAVTTLASNAYNLAAALCRADIVIGAVLIPGRSAPKLVTREMIGTMKQGAVAVDVAVDQGGCFETTHATTHSDPVYTVDGVVHYCVANMPGAVPRTSTFALNNATVRSEEHTSELQSLAYLVCRLLLEKKKKKNQMNEPHSCPSPSRTRYSSALAHLHRTYHHPARRREVHTSAFPPDRPPTTSLQSRLE